MARKPSMTVSEQLVAALTAAWHAIQAQHPEVPDVVLTVGSGTLGGRPGQVRYGHFAAARWQRGDAQMPELFVAGEGLKRGAGPVLGTLIHEAAHGLAFVRGIKDTSRQGKYHNKRFKALAEELGVVIGHDPVIGYSPTTLPPSTAAEYRQVLTQLEAALTELYRHAEQPGATKPKSSNYVKAMCECPRVIRVGKTVLAEAPITCGACGRDFVAEEAGDEDQD
ncbi:hypothetical protein [Longimycelium tulufanense]|nr:hypothetical protein [Longimycelium tulufanense]